MAKKMISFLGTAKYSPMTYTLNDKNTNATFVQEAMLDLLCSDFSEEDSLVILLTKKAKEENWSLLQEVLTKKKYNCKIKTIEIENKDGEAGVWYLFKTIFEDVLEENDFIYFDITNGFRYLPVVFYSVLNYSHFLKNTTTKGIYYAAYDQAENGIEPIIDLTKTYELMNWASAANTFTSYGISEELTKQIKKKDDDFSNAKKLGESINIMSRNINYSRGQRIIEGQIFSNCIEQINSYKTSDNVIQNPALEPILNKVIEKIENFKNNEPLNFLPAVEWYINHNMPAEALSMLKEGIITYLINEQNFNHRDAKLRLCLGKILSYISNKPYKYQPNEKPYISKIETIMKHPKANALQALVQSFNQFRNDIDHSGYVEQARNPDNLDKELKQAFKNVSELLTI